MKDSVFCRDFILFKSDVFVSIRICSVFNAILFDV